MMRLGLVVAILLVAASAHAEPLAGDRLVDAKELFRRGVALYEAGDVDGALDHFQRSRARFASMQNTTNVAICLAALGRDDEALEAYEEGLAVFAGEVDEAQRIALGRAIAALRARVGLVEVSSNVTGSVVIDARERARLPLTRAIRVTAGHHVVRVVKDGYATFETEIDMRAGGTLSFDARLTALVLSGGLRVEDERLAGADVFVDGALVGTAPWQGTLAPGVHVVWTRKLASGSPPTRAVVLEGQTALLRLVSGAFGPVAHLSVRPASAELRINGAPVARGRWEGALPAGHYRVEGLEEGYVPASASFDAGPDRPAYRGAIELAVDPTHSRWPRVSGRFAFSAFGGYGLGASLNSGAEQRCFDGCVRHGRPAGAILGLRGGYELSQRLAIEGAAGYLSLGSSLTRTLRAGQTTYSIDDEVRVQGFWLAASLSYRVPLGDGWSVRPRVAAGFLVAHSSDRITGVAVTGSERAPISVDRADQTTHSTPFFAMTELGVERTWRSWGVGAAIHTFVIPVPGPDSSRGALRCAGACPPASSAVEAERAYGAFLVVMPQLTVTYLP